MKSDYQTNRNGFTLIEVIVSITLMAVISAVVVSALRTSFIVWDKETKHLESLHQSRAALEVLVSQIRGALPLIYGIKDGDRPVNIIAFEGDQAHVRFVSRTGFKDGPDSIARWVDIRWTGKTDGQMGELVAEERRILPPDNSPDSTILWKSAILKADECSFEFLSLRVGNRGRNWTREWHYPSDTTLPAAVRMKCVAGEKIVQPLIALDYAESSAAGLVIR